MNYVEFEGQRPLEEILGRSILRYKYLNYNCGVSEISDYDYDMLEERYIKIMKEKYKAGYTEEPDVHIIADWNELGIQGGMFAACIVGCPTDHPWLPKEGE